jgi:hypothetical protein
VTGNEDGAHHAISEVASGLIDIGFTIPGAGLDALKRGPGPRPLLPIHQRGQGLVPFERPDGGG